MKKIPADEKKVLAALQCGLPLTARPFAAIADRVGLSETRVIAILKKLIRAGVIRRIGPVFNLDAIRRVSVLCAVKLDEDHFTTLAQIVGDTPNVSHCYVREDVAGIVRHNVWFTVGAQNTREVNAVIAKIARAANARITVLRTRRRVKLDMKFPTERK